MAPQHTAGFRPTQDWLDDRPARPSGTVSLATQETIGSSQWVLELRDYVHEPALVGALRELAAHSGGANPFFEPEFLAASVDRLGEGTKKLMILWEHVGDAAAARLAFPVIEDRVGLPARRVLRAWSHPFAPLSTPLIDQRDAEESCRRFAALLARLNLPGGLPLVFEDLPAEDPLARPFAAALRAEGLAVLVADIRRRAGLPPHARLPVLEQRRRRKELGRQFRRLSDLGHVEYEKATDFESIIVRFEEFLLLETRGWKGRRGTSIYVIRKTASFARQAVASLGDRGRAAIYSLRLDGHAIAALIVLRSGGRYYPWKIAFDEHYAAYSPGVQLLLHASADMIATEGFVYADSLAREHSWAERLWPDTIALQTLVVAAAGAAPAAQRAAGAVARRAWLRRLARRLLRLDPPLEPPLEPPVEPARGSGGE